jgi:hypothetical protein
MPPTDSEQAINVKEAYANAVEFARQVIGDLPFSLEEIDRGEYKGIPVWELTLGYPAPQEAPRPGALPDVTKQFASLFGPPTKVYKRFFVNLHTGEVMSMKLRESNGS